MNNEIKVILDKLKDDYWRKFPEDGIPYKVLYMEEVDLLLNYITNLQQENEINQVQLRVVKKEYKEYMKKTVSYEDYLQQENEIRQQDINNLTYQLAKEKEENEELKKKLDRRYYKNEYERLQQENERLKEDLKGQENLTLSYCKSEQDYKSRCEKAIEYIEDNEYFETEIFDYNTGGCLGTDLSIQAKTLLNILQNGSDSQ